MGPNPHANWCVTRPWFDHLLGTREPYLGTERERQDRQRLAARAPGPAEAATIGGSFHEGRPCRH